MVSDLSRQISGRHAAVQELVHKIERDERAFAFDPHTEDVHCVSSLLKVNSTMWRFKQDES
jgi:hypothetical protein